MDNLFGKKIVTVTVATYNSAKFVIETLDSIVAQTYPNIELIISDDCSSDDTIRLCRDWLNRHKNRFLRYDIITVPANTGVSANANRCLNAATSQWIKLLAGDDILLPNCIEDNIKYITAHPGIAVVFSQVLLYKNEFKEENFIRPLPAGFPTNLMRKELDSFSQFKLLLLCDRINYTPSVFLKKETVLELGGFDESIKLVEDYPMWLKLTKAGNRLYYFHIPTVGYRQHGAAVNNMKDYGLFKPLYLKSWGLRKKYIYPNLPSDIRLSEMYIFFISYFFNKMGLNKNNFFCEKLYQVFTIFFNPFKYIIYIKKKFIKRFQGDLFYIN